MASKIQIRRGTAALWTSTNTILADGEQGHETDTNRRKIGDGVTAWNSLPYLFETGGETITTLVESPANTFTYTSEDNTVTTFTVGGGGGSSDHGALTGLGDDDHTQYHNDARGDARYYTQTQLDTGQLDTRYETSAELDARDTANRDRANHTGTQLSTTISDMTARIKLDETTTTLSYSYPEFTYTDEDGGNTVIDWRPYRVSANSTNGLINQTTTEANYLLLNIVAPEAGQYELVWSSEWSINSTGGDFIGLIRLDGNEIAGIRTEGKDAAGTGVTFPTTTGGTANTGTDQKLSFAGEIEVNLTAGAHTLALTINSNGIDLEAAYYRGYLKCVRVG